MEDRQIKRRRGVVVVVIVGFITTYATSAYIHYCYESSSDVCYSLYNIMGESLSLTCGDFLRVFWFP